MHSRVKCSQIRIDTLCVHTHSVSALTDTLRALTGADTYRHAIHTHALQFRRSLSHTHTHTHTAKGTSRTSLLREHTHTIVVVVCLLLLLTVLLMLV